jgi:prevent-host-death family protein
MKVSIKKARERFSEIVNLVNIKGERVILTCRNRPKAAIVSLRDMEILENKATDKDRRMAQLERIHEIKKGLAGRGVTGETTEELQRMREERGGAFAGCH